ncbi:hypothetical protein PRJ_3735 [Pseudomonas sp. XWY-1]|nr:hypothetical protein PRJ_3735 [Pseudomonas sp. XWY-1]
MVGRRPRVGAGLPAKGPVLPTNLHPPLTVAVATVFAGKPDLWERTGPRSQSTS